jgi:putative transposase
MAETLSMALAELLRKADAEPDVDTLREGVRVMTQALMELEVAQHLGAERYQRSPERQGERNGYRNRDWDTRVGTLELRVPRVRDGSFFPGLLEPRKRAEPPTFSECSPVFHSPTTSVPRLRTALRRWSGCSNVSRMCPRRPV